MLFEKEIKISISKNNEHYIAAAFPRIWDPSMSISIMRGERA